MKILLDMNLPPVWVDFLVAASKDAGPSVIQVRTQNVMPSVIGSIVVNAINKLMAEIQSGSLISIDRHKARARILPFE